MPQSRTRSVFAWLALIAMPGVAMGGGARAADGPGFLTGIHRFNMLTSTVPDNGDQNPYAIVVAPVSAGKIHKDEHEVGSDIGRDAASPVRPHRRRNYDYGGTAAHSGMVGTVYDDDAEPGC